MKISAPKPLFPLLGRPIISYVLDAIRDSGIGNPFVITSPSLRAPLGKTLAPGVKFAIQPRPLGTGNAVMQLRPLLKRRGTLVVINADNALFMPQHIKTLLSAHAESDAQVTFATAKVDDPRGLGRVLRDPRGNVTNIVEETEASNEVKLIREINAGLYAFEIPEIFDLLSAVKPVGLKREVYLTRAVELAIFRGLRVATISVPQESSFGVNTLSEAALAQSVLLSRKLAQMMASGVIIDDPASVSIDWDVTVEAGSRILPGTVLRSGTRAGRECEIGPHSVIAGSFLGDNVTVMASWVSGSRLGDGVQVGPFAHIRPGCRVEKGARIGSHAEINRSRIGPGVRMMHFGYLGDTVAEAEANIAAGAVVANYDGKEKWPSRIGRGAFVGAGSVLVAPARVGDHAVLGAGSVLTARRAVPARAVWAGVPAKPLTKGKKKRGRKA